MKRRHQGPQPPPGRSEAPPAAAKDPYVALAQAARSASSLHEFYRDGLACIAASVGSPYASLVVRLPAQVVHEDCHCGPTDPNFWKDAVSAYLTESLSQERPRARILSARGAALKVALIAAPVHDAQGASIGALALVVMLDRDDAGVWVERIRSLAAFMSYAASTAGSRPAEAASPSSPVAALGRAAGYESVEELAFSLTNNLRNKLGCEQVALGLVRGRRCRAISISGLDEVKPRTPGVLDLQAAMEECLDAGCPIVSQAGAAAGPDETHSCYRLHRQWHRSAGQAAVASVPLFMDDTCVAVVSVQRRAGEPFRSEEVLRIQKAVAPYAPALVLIGRARRGLLRHSVDSVREAAAALLQPGRRGARAGAGLSVAAAVWFFFGSLDYRIAAVCTAVPAESRHVAAEFDGVLAATHVKAGDVVSAGQVLCRFDARDLELQADELRAQAAVAEQERLRAMAGDARADARLADANARLLQARLVMLTRRIERATVRSPIDGVIVEGDLERRLGASLARGEPLFVVAPAGRWTLEIEAPQRVTADLAGGLTGWFAPLARPEETTALTVTRVRPMAAAREGQNVFIAEAEVAAAAPWIRPGMAGMVRIDVGRRRVWWIVTHRIIEYLHVHFWI